VVAQFEDSHPGCVCGTRVITHDRIQETVKWSNTVKRYCLMGIQEDDDVVIHSNAIKMEGKSNFGGRAAGRAEHPFRAKENASCKYHPGLIRFHENDNAACFTGHLANSTCFARKPTYATIGARRG
jgi:hypothetical protein